MQKFSPSAFLQKNFVYLVIAICILGAGLRFYNYPNRWGLAYDQARDALVARSALDQTKIPLVGPFSSAGPFQTGGEWYWLIMLGTQFSPSRVIAPWVFMTSLYVLYIALLIYFGKEVQGKAFGLLLGLMGAISTAQIAQSVHLTNQTPLAFISLLAIWSGLRCIRTRRLFYFFALGFFISLAASIHLQGVALGGIILVTFLFLGLPTIREILALALGLLLPALPLLTYDIQNDFTNIRHMVQYYLFDQYKISLDVLGRRWSTYITQFWVKEWSFMIGGHAYVAILIVVMGIGGYIYSFFRKENIRVWSFIGMCFLILVTIIRYARVPLFDSFVSFTHPFVLILTAFSLHFLLKHMKLLGIVTCIIILFGTMVPTIREVTYGSNLTAEESIRVKGMIYRELPSIKYAVYDYNYLTAYFTLPVVLYLHADGRVSDTGKKIGFALDNLSDLWPGVASSAGRILYDLSGSTSAELVKSGWHLVTPNSRYLEAEEWRQYHK
jgi:hypothetical protein